MLTYEAGSSVFLEVDQKLWDRDAIILELQQHLLRAHQRMKVQADSKCRDISFEVGDMVFLKLRPYRQHSLARKANEKLSSRFYGPFKILTKIGSIAYRLLLLDDCQIHPVFHVSQLKQVVGSFSSFPHQPMPPQLDDSLQLKVQPEAVLGIKPHSGQQHSEPEVIIKWQIMKHPRNPLL